MRFVLYALALFHGANGAVMLAAPDLWYATVPDVAHTGPFNPHFVRDIGIAFLAASVSLVLGAGGNRAVLWPGATFLGGHAALHMAEMALHGTTATAGLRDLALILVPGLLPLAILALPRGALPEQTR